MSKCIHWAIRVVALGGIVLLACDQPVAPSATGGLNLQILLAPGDIAALDSGHIVVVGPSWPFPGHTEYGVAPGAQRKIDGLVPGQYTVAFEGFSLNAVARYGEDTVAVKAGPSTPATVQLSSFATSFTPPLLDSIIGKRFNLSFARVTGAQNYLVEWSKDQNFVGAKNSTTSALTIQDSVPDYFPYFFRVRAIDKYGERGPASAGSIRFVPNISEVYLVFKVQPLDTAAGQPITPQVAIEDSLFRVVVSATTSVTIAIGTNPTGATLGGTTTVSAVNGVATFSDLNITKAGSNYTLTASASGLAGGVSSTFAIKAGAPSKLAFTVQPAASTAGHAITPHVVVAIQDAYGNVNNGATNVVTISIRADSTGAKLKGATATFVSGGFTTFTSLSVDRPDTAYRLVATSGALAPDTSAPAAAHVSFSLLTTGQDHACGIATDSIAYCWGSNDSLQLGDSTSTSRLTPAPVAGGLKFTAISAGGFHTCGVSGGEAYCWGNNKQFQLGVGVQDSAPRNSPTLVFGGHSFRSLSSGYLHTCAVTANGVGYCWGYNFDGELGSGDDRNKHSVPVAVSVVMSFDSISAGGYHTCGVSGGSVYCWGNNSYGQLGIGVADTIHYKTPALVSTGFGEVGAGFFYTCGMAPGGAAYCWGDNPYGQLGVGDTVHRTSPTRINGFLFNEVKPGWFHACGVGTNDAAYCWGYDGFGELGDDRTTQQGSPVAVSSGGRTYSSIATGRQFTCGLTSTSPVAWCWGDNRRGQLGNGETNAQANALPRQVVQ